ncbi:MAG: YqcC family protein [Bdellovibrionales bacterium]|nr:YqcC family protein [Bdellovibrionales bacterium]
MSDSKYDLVAKQLAAIEQELRTIGWWSSSPPTLEQLNFQEAFAADTMAYHQWLQFVFIPRVQTILNAKGDFPPSSNVGIRAIREYDGLDKANSLVELLCNFDRIIEE